MPTGPQSSDSGRARASALDLLQLAAALGADFLRGKRRDPAAAGSRWVRGVMKKRGGANLEIASLELVADQEHSAHVLDDVDAHPPGTAKASAMSFLAP